MATIERRPISQRTASVGNSSKKDPKWLPLVSQLEELTADDVLALRPDSDETIRALKVQISRAATRAGRKDEILYAQSPTGELEVWLRDKPKQTRAPRKKRSDTGEG